ncbi:hypothetical protein HIM_08151 [Hirsutella minnesotensis 3608]|uniref:Fe2OG dioxygenase domain-containing protein n=1 Tax=Hirsutella minnesotensis 3608 TaxID=1043627 RepID=A0A0F7ZYH5_9HYPO|nr:hypothetical protein HIM_08151 [Hirsutella minnesotensis 3608]
MFSYDSAALPKLTTRKALIAIDFQNDFDSSQGCAALPVVEPKGFVTRMLALTEAFRTVGDVVWVQSCFEQTRPVDGESILASDSALPHANRRRRSKIPEPSADTQPGPPDPEAFLSHQEPTCVMANSFGAEVPLEVKKAVRNGDVQLRKTCYSAFTGTPLLRLLRAKMIMEVFICGSLTNIGVYATALDAAGHGVAITIVEDCCGYRSETRQMKAIHSLVELTGCEVASSQEVFEAIRLSRSSNTRGQLRAKDDESAEQAKRQGQTSSKLGKGQLSPSKRRTRSPSISKGMARVRLTSRSPERLSVAAKSAQSTSRTGQSVAGANDDTVGEEDKTDDSDEDSDEEVERRGANSPNMPPTSTQRESSPATLSHKEGADTPLHPKTKCAGPPAQETQSSSRGHDSSDAETGSGSATEAESDSDKDEDEDDELILCDGDTTVIPKLLSPAMEAGVFDKLRREVQWQRMSHQGGEVPRLVAVQGAVMADGSMPVYRHPSDESPPLLPFSPTVDAVRSEVEKRLCHPVNHVLIQCYRDGNDYISEHSDKTLDIVQGSYIANVSLGAQRTMVLRTKRAARDPSRTATDEPHSDGKRRLERAILPHNSLCKMGLATNMKWLHSIRQDRRADRDKAATELAFGGTRISLTFRRIGTFLSHDESMIWGQGATGKTRENAHLVINGQGPEAIAMLRAFGNENHSSNFDWCAHYGDGFDVLHIRSAARFFASADNVVNMRITLMLAELGISYAKGSMAAATTSPGGVSSVQGLASAAEEGLPSLPVKFVDNDADRTAVHGDMAIMLYLDSCYGRVKTDGEEGPWKAELASRITLFQRALHLYDIIRRHRRSSIASSNRGHALGKAIKQELTTWDASAKDASRSDFIAGSVPTIADFALWPVLHALVDDFGEAVVFDGLPDLRRYYHAFAARDSVKKIAGASSKEGST